MQIFVVPKPNGKHTVLKHIIFKEPITGRMAHSLVQGTAFGIQWGRQSKAVGIGLQFMFQNLGGFQCRCFTLASGPRAKVQQSMDEFEIAFETLTQY